MFVGHYAFSYGAKRIDSTVPMWVLFLAVQFLDLLWAPLVLLDVEKVRIVPGFTASNALDLYYMPYTHGLLAALGWSALAYLAYRALGRGSTARGAVAVAIAVFSHWILDLVVHVPDLPLWDDRMKVGLGLWNRPGLAFALEALVLFAGIAAYFTTGVVRRWPTLLFGALMVALLWWTRIGPAPTTDRAFAASAIVSYVILAVVAWLVERVSRNGIPTPARPGVP